jgi:EAL domain-containing protein (putative c-di-GMP-specific phosphodiesterase class I)
MSPTDALAHFQDGMYLVLIERPDRDALFAAADRMRMAISHADTLPNRGRLRLSATVGLCEAVEGEQQAEVVVHNARGAAIAGQEQGGNRCLWFEPARGGPPDPRTTAVTAQGRAVPSSAAAASAPQRYLLPLLPINGRLHGQYWVKYRWPPSQAGLPMQNYADYVQQLDAAQRVELDRSLIEQTLDLRAAELKRGKQVRLFVELSSALLTHGGLPAWLGQRLGEKRLSGTGLTLAFPGAVGIDQQADFVATAPALSQLGVRLALMHLGRDMALIHHLRMLPCDFVVLMPEVIEGLNTEGRQPVIETLLRKAREAGSATIVPGVEKPEWLPRLKALRVDYALSQRFGPPMPRADFDFDVPIVS